MLFAFIVMAFFLIFAFVRVIFFIFKVGIWRPKVNQNESITNCIFLSLCFFLAITTAFFIETDSFFYIFFLFFSIFSHGCKYFFGVAVKVIGRTKRKIKKNTKAITLFSFFSFALELNLLSL